MSNLSVTGKERMQKSPATLGDVLYAKSKAPVPEQDWAALVQSVAAGDHLALHALYERAHRMVFTLVIRIQAYGSEFTRDRSRRRKNTISKPEPMVKGADKPKSIHREPHQRKDAGNSNFASS